MTPPPEPRPWHRSLGAIVGLGVLLLLPTAGLGFYADDHLHQLILRGEGAMGPMGPGSLYDFGTREDWKPMDGNVGGFPWWTDENWQIRFLRPLSSLYLLIQHSIWGEWALGYHLVGLVLHVLLLLSAYGLYRAVGFSEWAARVGTLLLAVSDSVVLPVGWIANQNSLLVALFSVNALRLLIGGRLFLGLLLSIAAVAAKETGVITLAGAGVFLLFRSDRRSRAVGVLALALGMGYVTWFLLGGYGTRSVFYATPWREPVQFLQNLAVLMTAGPASFLGPFPLDAVTMAPQARLPMMLVGGLLGGAVWVWVGRTVRGAKGTGLLALWSVVFLLPQAGTVSADRLLFLPGVGALGLLALFFESMRDRSLWRKRILWWAITAGSGLSCLIQGFGLAAGSQFLAESVQRTDVGDPGLGHRDLFVLQTESQFQAFTLASMWGFHSEDHDLTYWNLQNGRRSLRWTRVDERSFDLESLDEPFLSGPFETVYLVDPPDVQIGDRWRTSAFEVEAIEVHEGRPTILRFHFQADFMPETTRFLVSREGQLVRVPVPAAGESVTLPAPERAGPFMP